MKRLVTSLSPNAEADDVRLAVHLLLQPWKWRERDATAHLEHTVGVFFRSEAITFESGRTALTAALQALHLPPGSEVILQAFTCVAVPNSIRWAGYTPVYADVDADAYTLAPQTLAPLITSRTRAILIQHTFGIPADMDALMKFAKEHGLAVIEDCAHSFGSRWRGQLLGTFGDVAIFSFGRDKALSSVFGGVTLTRRTDVAQDLRKIQSSFPLPSFLWIAQQLMHPLVLAASLRFYDVGGLGKVILEAAKRLHLISKAVESEERQGVRPKWTNRQLCFPLAQLALHQWRKRERFDAHRRRLTQIYTSLFAHTALQLPRLSPHADSALLRYPIRSLRRDQLFQAARGARIQLGDWYTSPLAPEGVNMAAVGYQPDHTPVARKLAQETLNLPTHIHIREEDAHRIAALIKAVLT